MLKKPSFFALIIILSFNASAQVSFGVRGGTNLNFLSVKAHAGSNRNIEPYKADINFALYAGAFVKMPITGKFSFKPGIDLMTRGGGRSERERISIYYLDVPLSIEYAITEKFYLEAAPVASLRVAARTYAFALQKRIDVTPSVEPFSFGLSAGAGYFITPKLAIHALIYRAMNKAWDITFRDVNNMPDGSVSYFPGSVSAGVEYFFGK